MVFIRLPYAEGHTPTPHPITIPFDLWPERVNGDRDKMTRTIEKNRTEKLTGIFVRKIR